MVLLHFVTALLFVGSALALSIVDLLQTSDQFEILLQHLEKHNLLDFLINANSVTLLAPITSAFNDVGDSKEINRSLLEYHIIKGELLSEPGTRRIGYSLLNQGNYSLPVLLESAAINHNISIIKSNIQASNGVIHVLRDLNVIPESASKVLHSNRHTSIFARLVALEASYWKKLISGQLNTVLVPSDSAFETAFNNIEINYLMTKFAKNDRRKLLANTLVQQFLPSTSIGPDAAKVLTVAKTTLTLSDTLVINDEFVPDYTDTLAFDAVLHFYPKWFLEKTIIDFTPEKYVLGLDAHGFWKELEFRNLLDLINGKEVDPQTLFVPIGDPQDVYESSKNSILYHFALGQHTLDFETALNSNLLLETKSNHKKLGGNQRIKVTASEKTKSIYLNGRDQVTSGPYVVGNTTLYTIRGSLDMPPAMDLSAGSIFQSSQSAKYMNDQELLNLSGKTGWSVLLPTTLAWEKLGLVQTYLESNKTALKGVLESLIFKVPFYSNSHPINTTLYDGTNVRVSSDIESLVHYQRSRFNLTVGNAVYKIETPNVLASNGVIHSVSDIHIPVNVDINPENILTAVDTRVFKDLLYARNFSYVLDPNSSYTILAPSDQVLISNNVTVNTPNIDKLLKLHILPNKAGANFLNDGVPVETLQKGIHLTAKELNSGLYLVSVVEGDSHEIRVLNRGDTSIRDEANITTILYVDRYLSPEWIVAPGHPTLKTSVAVLLGVVVGAMLVFSVLSCGLCVFLGQQRRKIVLRQSSFGVGERRPLMSRRTSSIHSSGVIDEPEIENGSASQYGTLSHSRRGSLHSVSEPIPTIKIQQNREHGKHLGLPRV
jgi:uncharacterized surface protein with fasciclin (FAS1) repeats